MSAARESDASLLELVAAAARGEEHLLAKADGLPDRPLDPAPEVIPGREPPAFDRAALHGPVGDFVRLVEPASEADPAALLIQALAALGSAANRSAYFQVEGSRHYLNINALLVGRTSKARKGTSWGRVEQLMDLVDPVWVRTCVAKGGLSSGEGLIHAVRDPIMRAATAKERAAGQQEVCADPGVADKRLLVLEEEFASPLGVMRRDGSTLSPLVRQAFDTGNLRSLTRQSPLHATHAHIAILGHITAAELQQRTEETDCANGFLNRFALAYVERSKCLPEGGSVDPQALETVAADVHAGLAVARRGGEIRRSPRARALWAEIYPGLSEGRPGMLGAVTGRAEAIVTRLSCLYAILDRSLVVGEEHLQAALVLWRYCEDSARFVFGEKLGDPTADAILALLKGAPPAGLTRTEIRDAFDRNKPAAELDRALGRLRELGFARFHKKGTAGRPAVVWTHSAFRTSEQEIQTQDVAAEIENDINDQTRIERETTRAGIATSAHVGNAVNEERAEEETAQ